MNAISKGSVEIRNSAGEVIGTTRRMYHGCDAAEEARNQRNIELALSMDPEQLEVEDELHENKETTGWDYACGGCGGSVECFCTDDDR